MDLDPAVFEAKVKPHLFHAEVRRQLAARRAGTHATKNRSAVSGGGVEAVAPEGHGPGAAGHDPRAPVGGGGVVFGPVPRSYDHKLPKKVAPGRPARRAVAAASQEEAVSHRRRPSRSSEYKTKQVVELHPRQAGRLSGSDTC